jgi:hypothetical protein
MSDLLSVRPILKISETPDGRSGLVVRRGPNKTPAIAATKSENTLQGWDNFLHDIWLDKMEANPGMYLDVKGDS